MTPQQRADALLTSVEKEGRDNPSQDEIAETIAEAEGDIETGIIMALRSKGFGMAADYLERLDDQRQQAKHDDGPEIES